MTLDRDGGVDPRLVRVPAGDYKDGTLLNFCFFCHLQKRRYSQLTSLPLVGDMREIFFAYELFPRYVGYARNVPEYFPKGNEVLYTAPCIWPLSMLHRSNCQ